MRRLLYILCCMVLGALLAGCNVTRHIPSDAYLLQRVKIEEDKSLNDYFNEKLISTIREIIEPF